MEVDQCAHVFAAVPSRRIIVVLDTALSITSQGNQPGMARWRPRVMWQTYPGVVSMAFVLETQVGTPRGGAARVGILQG